MAGPRRAVTRALGALLILLPLWSQVPDIADAPWVRDEVAVGVVWRRHHFEALFGGPQNVNVLEIDLRVKGVALRFASPGGFRRTSRLGRERLAVAAVNGGFFDGEGRSVGVLRIDGEERGQPHEHRSAALVLGAHGRPRLVLDPRQEWPEARWVMSAGPMLVSEGRVREQLLADKPRHPRTAVGLTARARLLLVTVDGRTPQSRGVTLHELAGLMTALGAREALNLDGGGSTTMWVRGEGAGGVVSRPCDNRRFDHAGERRVGNAILVFALDIIDADTDEAELVPEEAWERRSSGAGFWGPDYAVAAEDGARARWRIPVEIPGTYEVRGRWPRNVPRLTSRGWAQVDDKRKRFSQRSGGGRWQPLLRVRVPEPTTVAVEIGREGPGMLAADALRLIQVADDSRAPPPR
jgi:hypothetical protein